MNTKNKSSNLGRQTQKENATTSEGEHKKDKELRNTVLNLIKWYCSSCESISLFINVVQQNSSTSMCGAETLGILWNNQCLLYGCY